MKDYEDYDRIIVDTRNNLAIMRAFNPPGFRRTNSMAKAAPTITTSARFRCHNLLGGVAASLSRIHLSFARTTISRYRAVGKAVWNLHDPQQCLEAFLELWRCVGSDGTLGTFSALIARTA
jgi:hypothetical protein